MILLSGAESQNKTQKTGYRPLTPAPLTCAIDRAGMNLTVVTPASSQCAAALLQGDMAGEHTLAQVLIVQIIVALLTFHWRR